MSKATLALPFALALAASALGCAPEVPAHPTYANDVQPIMMAHCARCHGAGNMLRGDPAANPPSGPPGTCYLQRYGDEGTDCGAALEMDCRHGARWCGNRTSIPVTPPTVPVSYIESQLFPAPPYGPFMPPPPATPLNAWELDVIRNWLNNVDAAGNPAP